MLDELMQEAAEGLARPFAADDVIEHCDARLEGREPALRRPEPTADDGRRAADDDQEVLV